jgi:hypothetical protein
MRILDSLNRFCQYLRRGSQMERPDRGRSRLALEALEDRVVPSTRDVNFHIGGQVSGLYTASPGCDRARSRQYNATSPLC